VGSAIRCQYAGSVLNQSGQWMMWRSPNNLASFASGAIGDLLKLNTTTRRAVTREWVYQTYIPNRPLDLQYTSLEDRFKSGGPAPLLANPYANLAYFIGLVGGEPGASIEWEVCSHYEMVGSGIPITTSHPDPVGLSQVISAAPSVPHNPNPQIAYRSALRTIYDHTIGNKAIRDALLNPLVGLATEGISTGLGGALGLLQTIIDSGGTNSQRRITVQDVSGSSNGRRYVQPSSIYEPD